MNPESTSAGTTGAPEQGGAMPHGKTFSAWLEGWTPPEFPALEGDASADVVVVGGGITGVITAAHLQERGLSVILVEGRPWGHHGTTHRTSGHLTAVLDISFTEMTHRFGEGPAGQVVGLCQQALDDVERFSREAGTDFFRVDGCRYTEDESQRDNLREDAQEAQKLGLAVNWLDRVPLPFPTAGGYAVAGQGIFHPVKFISALAMRLREQGVRVHASSQVLEVTEGEPCEVKLERGTLRARKVVLATHTPAGVWLSLQTRLVPYRSYCACISTSAEVPDGLFWDDADPYHYTRPFIGPDGRRRYIIGGCDHKTGAQEDTAERFAALLEWARQRFPGLTLDTLWSSQLFEPADGLPYIGLPMGSDHVLVATGYSGTGLSFGAAAGRLMADIIEGRGNPVAEVLSPRRLKPVASARRVLEEAGASLRGLVLDRLLHLHRGVLEEVRPGEGKTLECEGKKVAVHRDAGGHLHVVSAVCPHMGCIVHWNNAEQTWDCPCHGSIFQPDGAVVSGPSHGALERIQ